MREEISALKMWAKPARGDEVSSLTHFSIKSFCKSQFPHKSVNLFFTLLIVKDKLTDLWGFDFCNTTL